MFYFELEIQLLSRLEDVVVEEGETATFSCQVFPENTEVQWTLNAKPLYQNRKFKIDPIEDERTLSIRNCEKKDSGPVSVIAGKYQSTADLLVKGILKF